MMNFTPWIDTVNSMDSQTTETDDDEGYYGQDVLQERDNPDTTTTDDDGFQGEDSWQDFQKDEDGEGSRYDRGDSTNWVEDAALQFDTDVVDGLTVPDLDFTEIQQEAFSERGQTAVPDGTTAEPDGSTAPGNAPEAWQYGGGPVPAPSGVSQSAMYAGLGVAVLSVVAVVMWA